jgi:hypothetical protein
MSNELIGGKVIRSCASVMVVRKVRGREGGRGYVSNSRREGRALPAYDNITTQFASAKDCSRQSGLEGP